MAPPKKQMTSAIVASVWFAALGSAAALTYRANPAWDEHRGQGADESSSVSSSSGPGAMPELERAGASALEPAGGPGAGRETQAADVLSVPPVTIAAPWPRRSVAAVTRALSGGASAHLSQPDGVQ